MRKFAILASNENPTYAFYLPLTALLWRSIGYEPLVVTVGQWGTALGPVLDAFAELNVTLDFTSATRKTFPL